MSSRRRRILIGARAVFLTRAVLRAMCARRDVAGRSFAAPRRAGMRHPHGGHVLSARIPVVWGRRARRISPADGPEEDTREDQRCKESTDGENHGSWMLRANTV